MYFITMLCHLAGVTINFRNPENTKFVTFNDLTHITWLFGKCGNLGFVVFIQLFSLQFESVRNKTRFRKPTGFEFSVEIYFCRDFSFCQIAFLGSLEKCLAHFLDNFFFLTKLIETFIRRKSFFFSPTPNCFLNWNTNSYREKNIA